MTTVAAIPVMLIRHQGPKHHCSIHCCQLAWFLYGPVFRDGKDPVRRLPSRSFILTPD